MMNETITKMDKKNYLQFQMYFKSNYDEAAAHLIEHPEISLLMNKTELRTMMNLYKNTIVVGISEALKMANQNISESNSKLEKTIKEMGGKK